MYKLSFFGVCAYVWVSHTYAHTRVKRTSTYWYIVYLHRYAFSWCFKRTLCRLEINGLFSRVWRMGALRFDPCDYEVRFGGVLFLVFVLRLCCMFWFYTFGCVCFFRRIPEGFVTFGFAVFVLRLFFMFWFYSFCYVCFFRHMFWVLVKWDYVFYTIFV